MKKIMYFIFLIIFIGNQAASQENRIIAFSANKMKVVYASLDNPLTIAASGIPADKIKVIASKGSIKGENGNYILSVPDIRKDSIKEVEITVFEADKEISKDRFRIKIVPAPLAYFGEKDEGEISKDEINSTKLIQVKFKDWYFEGLDYTVKKYKLVIATKKKTFMFANNGPALTQEMIDSLAIVNKGDIIIITDIYASFPSSSDFRLPGAITLTVK